MQVSISGSRAYAVYGSALVSLSGRLNLPKRWNQRRGIAFQSNRLIVQLCRFPYPYELRWVFNHVGYSLAIRLAASLIDCGFSAKSSRKEISLCKLDITTSKYFIVGRAIKVLCTRSQPFLIHYRFNLLPTCYYLTYNSMDFPYSSPSAYRLGTEFRPPRMIADLNDL